MRAQILVVDDESDMEVLFRQQFRRDLTTGRFGLAFASSGSQALRMIETAAGDDIILLLSDVNMPGMSGLDLVPRAKEVRPDMPILMVTAYGDAGTRAAALARGADELLTKPIDFAALRADLERRLERREACP